METNEFTRTSHAVWQAMAAGWEERHAYFESVARPVTERMLERLAPAGGQTLLDLAAGTGVVGFAASPLVEPGGRVIVSDFSEAMVEAAERRSAELGLTNVDFRVLDAERLDLPSGAVDGVLCRWGYMLMADPAAALAETRRVLRTGGRLSCAVFAGPEQNPWAAIPSRVLQERGHVPPPEPGTPGILALADRDRLGGLITRAGFSPPQFDEVPFTLGFEGHDGFWEFLTRVAGAIAIVLDRLDDAERERVRAEIGERVTAFQGDRGLELPAVSIVAAAT